MRANEEERSLNNYGCEIKLVRVEMLGWKLILLCWQLIGELCRRHVEATEWSSSYKIMNLDVETAWNCSFAFDFVTNRTWDRIYFDNESTTKRLVAVENRMKLYLISYSAVNSTEELKFHEDLITVIYFKTKITPFEWNFVYLVQINYRNSFTLSVEKF